MKNITKEYEATEKNNTVSCDTKKTLHKLVSILTTHNHLYFAKFLRTI